MKYFLSILFTLVLSCAAKKTQKPEAEIVNGGYDCTAPSTLKMITFCASPQAATLATANAQIKNNTTFEKLSPLPLNKSPTLGPDDALVTVIMFTDLECPFCKDAHKIMTDLAKEKKIRLVFKHAPMPFHQAAIPSSLAAISAGNQNKFWEFVESGFENQADLSGIQLTKIATQLGLDTDTWKNDFGNADAVSIIENDMVLSRSAGVNATPTMFINGVRVVGLFPESEYKRMIAEQTIMAQKLIDAGVKKEDVHWRTLSMNYKKPEIVAEPEIEEKVIVKDVPIKGSPSKGAVGDDVLVTIVEFSDFQCPLCQQAHEKTKQILAENATDTRFVFHHFPLPFHEDADVAAVAAMVAQHFGKFWEYNDLLFANQENLAFSDLVGYAKNVGISKRKFTKQYKKKENTERLSAEIELAQKLEVQGTPTYFVNGIMVLGLPSGGSFEKLIKTQRALAKKISAEQGLKGDDLYRALVQVNLNNL